MTATVHVVEPGGRGGVYQHAAWVAGALSEAGVPVVLHTAADAEQVPVKVDRHACFWPFGAVRHRSLRRVAVAGAWLAAGVPSCLARIRPGDVVHLEGWFVPLLMAPLATGARLRRATVVLSPHTTFSRRRRPREERVVRWLARQADVALAFSEPDRRRLEDWGARVVKVPMMAAAVDPDPVLTQAWRRRWGADDGRRVALFAGQIRPDKGLDVAVRAAARWRPDLALAVVGEDLGALAAARVLAAHLGVRLELHEGYQPLAQLVAAVAAADVVVCPYRVASQSAVLVMAARLGRPTVASAVGGLPELATLVVPPDDPGALAGAVAEAVERRPVPRRTGPEAALAYVDAYGLR